MVLGYKQKGKFFSMVASLNKEVCSYYTECLTIETRDEFVVAFVASLTEALGYFKQLQRLIPRKVIIYRYTELFGDEDEHIEGEVGLAMSTLRLAVADSPNPFYKEDVEPLLTYIVCEAIEDGHV